MRTYDAQGKQKALASAVLLPSGKVATNCHVVEGGVRFQVGRGKKFVPATLYAGDGDKDICLLDAKDVGGTPTQLGKAANLKVGVPVYAVGAPRGLELSLSDGIVSQLRGGPPPIIQTTAAISPGSSGGGLFDSEGRLVGLTTLYIDGGQSLNFAMPVEWLAEIKPGLMKPERGRKQADWFKRAVALEERKAWQDLLAWCREWTMAEPKDSGAWAFLGSAHADLNNHAEAINAYRQSLRIDPKPQGVWHNLMASYRVLRRHADVIDALRQVLRIYPESSGYWNTLGFEYELLNRDIEAIEAFRQAVRLDPEYINAWDNLALAYVKTGNQAAALDAVRVLRRLDPERAEQLRNMIRPR